MIQKSNAAVPAKASVEGYPIKVFAWEAEITEIGEAFMDGAGHWVVPVRVEMDDSNKNNYGVTTLVFTLNHLETNVMDDESRIRLAEYIQMEAKVAFYLAVEGSVAAGRKLTAAVPNARQLLGLA